MAGQFSNLGRAFVNNDATNLYVGMDRVMIYGNNNIFLFLESPRLPGVTNLQAVGNGGWAGTISYGAMAPALANGYATVSTDTGHSSA